MIDSVWVDAQGLRAACLASEEGRALEAFCPLDELAALHAVSG